MGAISGYNPNNFISSKEIFASVKRGLSSFAGTDIIDENEFPIYTQDVLKRLGNAVKVEDSALIQIVNYEGKLPDNFNQLHSAFRCDLSGVSKVPTRHLQNTISFENDITYELLCKNTGCDVSCGGEKVIEKIEVKQYFNDFELHYNFSNPVLLSLSPNVRGACAKDCLNFLATSDSEISISDKTLTTNFGTGNIFIRYYGNPVDEEGYPIILDDQNLINAIEWYIKYRVFLNLWENDAAPNVENKWKNAKMEYESWLAEARFTTKLPSFSKMIDSARKNRTISAVNLFSSIDKRR